jgi:signal transduction histidine kinase
MFQMSVGPQAPRRPARTAGDIQGCITQAVHEVQAALESKSIDLRLELIPPPEKLFIDEVQIEQVLVNLLDNACRFTPRNGRIEIKAYPAFWDRRYPQMTEGHELPDRRASVCCDRNAYRIEVRDSGPGVPPADLERIFQEYTTSSSGSDLSRAGLGLAICHQIVKAHQGIVFAESRGQGANFIFILPFAENTSQLDAPQPPAGMMSVGSSG